MVGWGGLAYRGPRVRVERAERHSERPDARRPELPGERGDDRRRAERDFLTPRGIVDNDLEATPRERTRLSAPRHFGSHESPPPPPDRLLEEPVRDLRDGGGQDLTDGAGRR